MVCMRPKAVPKFGPEQKSAWYAQAVAGYSFMSLQVARAMPPPGIIHGTTPTPSGNTTGHSVANFHSARKVPGRQRQNVG